MLSFTHIIDYLITNKTKIIDDIYDYTQNNYIDSEYMSFSIHFSINTEIYYLISRESDDIRRNLFLNLFDIWIDKDAYELTKDDIEAEINHVIKHLRRLITTNPHI